MSLPVAVDRWPCASFQAPPTFFQTVDTVKDGSSFGVPLYVNFADSLVVA